MYTKGLVTPLFSLAILRDTSGPAGYLALGGMPPIDFVPEFTCTPILITEIKGYPKNYAFYTIEIDSIVLGAVSLPGSGENIQYIVSLNTDFFYSSFCPPAEVLRTSNSTTKLLIPPNNLIRISPG
jgi:hypothetical protein